MASGSVNVAGVRTPSFELEEEERPIREYSLVDTSSLLDRSTQLSAANLKVIVELAELQRSLDLLGAEMNRTKRIVNALEYLIIPGLLATTRYLTMKCSS